MGVPLTDAWPFRFGTVSFQPTRSGVLADAHKAESQGYDIFWMCDHFEVLPPIAALAMLAEHLAYAWRLACCATTFATPWSWRKRLRRSTC